MDRVVVVAPVMLVDALPAFVETCHCTVGVGVASQDPFESFQALLSPATRLAHVAS